MGISRLTGSPWHIEYASSNHEGENIRRHKSKCVYYLKESKYCKKLGVYCLGSSTCSSYLENNVNLHNDEKNFNKKFNLSDSKTPKIRIYGDAKQKEKIIIQDEIKIDKILNRIRPIIQVGTIVYHLDNGFAIINKVEKDKLIIKLFKGKVFKTIPMSSFTSGKLRFVTKSDSLKFKYEVENNLKISKPSMISKKEKNLNFYEIVMPKFEIGAILYSKGKGYYRVIGEMKKGCIEVESLKTHSKKEIAVQDFIDNKINILSKKEKIRWKNKKEIYKNRQKENNKRAKF